jgi:hypothetical protein
MSFAPALPGREEGGPPRALGGRALKLAVRRRPVIGALLRDGRPPRLYYRFGRSVPHFSRSGKMATRSLEDGKQTFIVFLVVSRSKLTQPSDVAPNPYADGEITADREVAWGSWSKRWALTANRRQRPFFPAWLVRCRPEEQSTSFNSRVVPTETTTCRRGFLLAGGRDVLCNSGCSCWSARREAQN